MVQYSLNIPKITSGYWVFMIEAMENQPYFYIHPDKKPSKQEDYLY